MLNFISFITLLCCASLSPMSKADIDHAQLIFTGELIHKERPSQLDNIHESTQYHFKVLTAYKGCSNGDIIIVSSHEMISTGIHVELGDKWLLVPYGSEEKGWSTDICSHSGNTSSSRAKKNIRFLKKHIRPRGGPAISKWK